MIASILISCKDKLAFAIRIILSSFFAHYTIVDMAENGFGRFLLQENMALQLRVKNMYLQRNLPKSTYRFRLPLCYTIQ
ncbi:hypothetical protein HMPREF1250_1804 [Megasphaera vaginalis (ex Srinivasan et al. 2021)]|uniref:Uncharacterized protein n=1 Tax=Megasphaera vaginalis (ex Srinivasan et al. 2021) TaxID=1111454 RepID=U7UIE7_9FIRM|nr:hypothetical protein HMPREF1250_1804 [Megasphaera vaginalis (ex Srinivasan et al. 2021)]